MHYYTKRLLQIRKILQEGPLAHYMAVNTNIITSELFKIVDLTHTASRLKNENNPDGSNEGGGSTKAGKGLGL